MTSRIPACGGWRIKYEHEDPEIGRIRRPDAGSPGLAKALKRAIDKGE
jgi:hypothetical protein